MRSLGLLLRRTSGEGEENIVEVRRVDGQVLHGGIVAEAGEQLAQRSDAALIRYTEHEPFVVARAVWERSGGLVERGGVGEAEPDVRAGHAPFELCRGAFGDDMAPVEHGDAVSELVGLLQVLRGQ